MSDFLFPELSVSVPAVIAEEVEPNTDLERVLERIHDALDHIIDDRVSDKKYDLAFERLEKIITEEFYDE